MKIQTKDQYDLSLQGSAGGPGFEVFQVANQKHWAFVCNDIHGQPVLFSQLYQEAGAARKGMESVLQHLPKRISKIQTNMEQWQFVVTANNRQEIARSAVFDTEAECDKMLQYTKQVAGAKKPEAIQPRTEEEPAPPGKQAVEEQQAELRQSFRLFFYGSDSEGWSGKIEDMSKQVQQSFQGIDIEAIGLFLEGQLNSKRVNIPEKKQPRSGVLDSTKPHAASLQGSLSFKKGAKGSSMFYLLTPGEIMEVSIAGNHPADVPDGSTLMGTRLELIHTSTKKSTTVETGNIAFDPVLRSITIETKAVAALEAGSYQLQAEAWLQVADGLRSIKAASLVHAI